MDSINVRKQDQILMSLVHYFVTKENYSPIYVHGVKDEIWLEKLDGPYRVIRINSNHIFNDEQFKFDQYRVRDILRQIKKKTMSFSINALNINLNADERVNDLSTNNIDNIKVYELSEVEKNELITEVFPNIKDNLLENTNGLDLIFSVTKDINEKTERENKRFEKIFSPKKIYITYIIIALCIVMYLISFILGKGININTLVNLGANNVLLLRDGQVWRLITYAFLHGSLAHLLCNMYSLYIIGTQIEARYGKGRYIFIYLISAISGGLLSAGIANYNVSVGASGAIFGVLGAMVYFGYRFRLYFKDALRNRILPVILLNLFLGFMLPGIDNACHIGGLIAGYITAMAVGIPGDSKTKDSTNGIVLLLMYIAFLCYIAFIR
ncbi:MAG: rhomboid family intramembrane serine protease [Firmicutes bacterium]|nr:rhomboid family intramembrane serine protease [Bacillota bacterium]